MVRKAATTVLFVIAAWLAVTWIDSYLRPSRYSLQEIMQKFSMTSVDHWEIRFGLTNDSRQGKRGRQFTVVVESQYTVGPGEKPVKRLRPFDVPGLSFTNAGGVVDGPRPTAIENTYVLASPAWLVLIVLWAYPAYYFVRRPFRRFRRRRRGLCVKCGYNLTGAPGRRCPECGTAI